jgi:acetyl-CoA synthetase
LTYRELAERSSRFASALASLGIGKGDRVFVLTGRMPELYIAVLGGLKLGAVVCTLFAAFGPEPIAQRLRLGDGRVLVTTPELYDRKVAASRAELPELRHVFLTGDPADCLRRPGTRSLTTALDEAAAEFPIAPTRAEDPAPSCTSPAARRASPRAPSTCTAPSWGTSPRRAWCWICEPKTCTGAPRIPAG